MGTHSGANVPVVQGKEEQVLTLLLLLNVEIRGGGVGRKVFLYDFPSQC